MSKKLKIIISILVIILLFLIAVGIFWWKKNTIENYFELKEVERIFAPAKDYMIYETPEGKFIENKKDGLKAEVPENWKVEIGMDMFGLESERNVTLYSSDFSYRPLQGCLIEIQINRVKNEREEKGFLIRNVEEVKRDIVLSKENKLPNLEVISINQKEALKKTLEPEKHVLVEFPTEERVYSFEAILFSDECKQDFNKFLETISIQ